MSLVPRKGPLVRIEVNSSKAHTLDMIFEFVHKFGTMTFTRLGRCEIEYLHKVMEALADLLVGTAHSDENSIEQKDVAETFIVELIHEVVWFVAAEGSFKYITPFTLNVVFHVYELIRLHLNVNAQKSLAGLKAPKVNFLIMSL